MMDFTIYDLVNLRSLRMVVGFSRAKANGGT